MKSLETQLKKYASKKQKETNECFFKTGEGEYSEYDKFLGVCVPDIRTVAKKFTDLDFHDLQKNIDSPYNEVRLCVLIILVNRYKKKSTTKEEKERIYKFFIKNLKYINNWNLVDISIPNVIGEYLYENKEKLKILDELSLSKIHWYRRASILATWSFIKRNELVLTFKIAKRLLDDSEDLMHKTVGWMLREAWKKDHEKVENFLIKNYKKLPRTTLRYAIERMKEQKRNRFLKGNSN